jgi:hypothetical protein
LSAPVQQSSAPPTPQLTKAGAYKVVAGDSLSKIATAQNIDGGWQAISSGTRTPS